MFYLWNKTIFLNIKIEYLLEQEKQFFFLLLMEAFESDVKVLLLASHQQMFFLYLCPDIL